MCVFKDMSHVVGKNRKELLAMAKGLSGDKKGMCNKFRFLYSSSLVIWKGGKKKRKKEAIMLSLNLQIGLLIPW